ncbi:hypothetical protein [Candidatus Poriferisodalis sp.]|uniref:hypothetical protein n=1 Tax=Candidatus Poriferisodalis sp. TaxID=3101277 RepID=UPI003B5C1596
MPGGAWAAYCGNLQGRSFKPSECELKGALVVPVDSGQVGKPAFKPCDQVRFARSKVEVGPDDTIEDVCVKITDEASKLGSEHSALPVAWELRLTGHNADAARLRDAVRDCDAPLLTDMADELSDRLNGGGLCRVEMAVRAAVNRESVLAGHDLRADVLRELEMCRKQIHDKSVADDSSGLEKPGRAQADASEFGKQLPSKVASVWEEMIAERPERLDDILALAEELLLEIFADGVAEGS